MMIAARLAGGNFFFAFFGWGDFWVQWKNTGGLKQKHKKNSLLAMPVLRTCR